MSYEDAVATRKLGVRCLICRRPLLDAVSLTIGMGPICRARSGYNDITVAESERRAANRIIFTLAERTDETDVNALVEELRALGFESVADLAVKRLTTIRVDYLRRGDRTFLAVATPYCEAAVEEWKAIAGRRWDGKEKRHVLPMEDKPAAWRILCRYFPGALGVGPRGVFRVSRSNAT